MASVVTVRATARAATGGTRVMAPPRRKSVAGCLYRSPTMRSNVQRADLARLSTGHPSASRVARSILGSVKISRSSRLWVENSETIAPSSPA